MRFQSEALYLVLCSVLIPPLLAAAYRSPAVPDTVTLFECLPATTTVMGPFGEPETVPDSWLVHARVRSTASERTFIVAVALDSADLPDRLPAAFQRNVMSPGKDRRRAPGSPRLETPEASWFVLRAVKPGRTRRSKESSARWAAPASGSDAWGRAELDAGVVVRLPAGVSGGLRAVLYSGDGLRLQAVRPGAER